MNYNDIPEKTVIIKGLQLMASQKVINAPRVGRPDQ
jgi:hypothetical protein